MAVVTASGTKVYVAGVHNPATDTSTEYAALTWVEIGEVSNLGDFGDEANSSTFTALSDQRVRKIKGAFDAGTIPITVGRDALDAGQVVMKAGLATKFDYDFKVVASDRADANDTDSIFYFAGQIMSGRNQYGDNNNVVTIVYNVAINTPIIEVPRTVVA